MRRLILVGLLVTVTGPYGSDASRLTQTSSPPLTYYVTPHGVRLGILDATADPKRPAPIVFNFATSLEESLDRGYNLTAGHLVAQGWRAVSMDLPAHGRDARPEEALDRLFAWRQRLQAGQNLVEAFTTRFEGVIEDLIAANIADPNRIAVVGISRGAFLALHAAARSRRIKAVMAFVPVTDLLALEQFKGTETDPQITGLNLTRQAPALRSMPIWVTIGTQDPVVSTTACVQFALSIYQEPGPAPPKLELHVVAAGPHMVPPESYRDAAMWALKQFQAPK